MEAQFLELIEYNVAVQSSAYASCYFELRSLCDVDASDDSPHRPPGAHPRRAPTTQPRALLCGDLMGTCRARRAVSGRASRPEEQLVQGPPAFADGGAG